MNIANPIPENTNDFQSLNIKEQTKLNHSKLHWFQHLNFTETAKPNLYKHTDFNTWASKNVANPISINTLISTPELQRMQQTQSL